MRYPGVTSGVGTDVHSIVNGRWNDAEFRGKYRCIAELGCPVRRARIVLTADERGNVQGVLRKLGRDVCPLTGFVETADANWRGIPSAAEALHLVLECSEDAPTFYFVGER